MSDNTLLHEVAQVSYKDAINKIAKRMDDMNIPSVISDYMGSYYLHTLLISNERLTISDTLTYTSSSTTSYTYNVYDDLLKEAEGILGDYYEKLSPYIYIIINSIEALPRSLGASVYYKLDSEYSDYTCIIRTYGSTSSSGSIDLLLHVHYSVYLIY